MNIRLKQLFITLYVLISSLLVSRSAFAAFWSEMPSPTPFDLRSIWGSSGIDVYTVGNYGNIFHYNGNPAGTWSPIASGTSAYLRGVWGSSATDIFTVGDSGTILHYNGAWSPMSSGVSTILYSVWGSADDDVFAVGESGIIRHYDGDGDNDGLPDTIWEPMTSGTANLLRSVWGSAGNDVFIVGYSGAILHYNGSSWTPMVSGTGENLSGVWGSSGTEDVYAVGAGGVIRHYDGDGNNDGLPDTIWETMTSNTSQWVVGVWGNSGTDVFAAGFGGVILHYDGDGNNDGLPDNIWEVMASGAPYNYSHYAVWGSSGQNVFVVSLSGHILHYLCEDNSECDDGVYCNGTETCDVNGFCQPGTYPCSPPTPFCDEENDICFGCENDEECGFCEKCVSGICVDQDAGEDLKGECSDIGCGSGFCNGAGACGVDPDGTLCRASADDCDVAETCDGFSATCPADGFEPDTTECRAAAGVCDIAENCTGSSAECPSDSKSTAECRAGAGICDVAEFCDGVNNECPSDAKSIAECRPSQGVCDIAESCDGSNNDCPADVFEPPTTLCRASAGICDIPEYCRGDSALCPDDGYQPDGTPCDDGLHCTQIDECISGYCIGKSDPCIDNVAYCDGVEYCEEDSGSYSCGSTGNPCGEYTCNEPDDSCNDSDVTLIIEDAYGYSGDIDIKLKNCCNLIREVHADICDVDHRNWLHISTNDCSTTSRTDGFNCTLSDLGSNCVRMDLISAGSAAITPGTGAIAHVAYTLDANAPLGEYADVEPKNTDVVEKDTLESLLVTPIPGKIQAVGADSDSDGFPDYLDNCPDIPNGPLRGTCLKIYSGGYFKSTGIICYDEEGCGDNELCDTYQLDCNENGTGDACEIDADKDAVPDVDDNCPNQPNGPDGGTCIWGTNIGNSCSIPGYDPMECGLEGFCSMNQEELDSDEVGEACDNCPNYFYNPDQADSDSDGVGNACDNCPFHSNPDQLDSNSNGIGDACEAYKGNANGDETINICDVQLIINIFLGVHSPTAWELWAADCDNNEEINVADVQIAINKILRFLHV